MTKVVYLLAAGLVLIGSGAAYSSSRAKPATLASANGPIVAFAQDGNQIAWGSIPDYPPPRCAAEVRIRLVSKHKQKVITPPSGATCHDEYGWGQPAGPDFFVLAGRRALWETTVCGNYCHIRLTTGSYSAKRDQMLFPDDDYERYFYDYEYGTGDYLTAAADSSTIVYGVAEIGVAPSNCGEDSGITCTNVISGGSVNRVTGTDAVEIPGAPPPFRLAASGRRIAVIVAESSSGKGSPVGPGSPARVVVLDAYSGDKTGSFALEGRPEALAFSPTAVGALTSVSEGKQIEFYLPAGEPIRTVSVPAGATSLSMSSTRAVFRVGRSIWTVAIKSGAVKRIATAAKTPIGLSIEGTRVAWAENIKVKQGKRGRVRAITVK